MRHVGGFGRQNWHQTNASRTETTQIQMADVASVAEAARPLAPTRRLKPNSWVIFHIWSWPRITSCFSNTGISFMPEKPITDEEILRQIPAARRREAADRRAGRRALTARYDPDTKLVIVGLTNGCLFGFPVALVPGLEGATPHQLASVEVLPGGYGLLWPEFDADVSVPGLLASSMGRKESTRQFARIGGQSRSKAKAAAARANGAKGGRPPKKKPRATR
jgi:hypothetical protein